MSTRFMDSSLDRFYFVEEFTLKQIYFDSTICADLKIMVFIE